MPRSLRTATERFGRLAAGQKLDRLGVEHRVVENLVADVEDRRLADQEDLRLGRKLRSIAASGTVEAAGMSLRKEARLPVHSLRPVRAVEQSTKLQTECKAKDGRAAGFPTQSRFGPVGPEARQDRQAREHGKPEPVEAMGQEPPGQEQVGRVAAEGQAPASASRAAGRPGERRRGKAAIASPTGRRRRPGNSRTLSRSAGEDHGRAPTELRAPRPSAGRRRRDSPADKRGCPCRRRSSRARAPSRSTSPGRRPRADGPSGIARSRPGPAGRRGSRPRSRPGTCTPSLRRPGDRVSPQSGPRARLPVGPARRSPPRAARHGSSRADPPRRRSPPGGRSRASKIDDRGEPGGRRASRSPGRAGDQTAAAGA